MGWKRRLGFTEHTLCENFTMHTYYLYKRFLRIILDKQIVILRTIVNIKLLYIQKEFQDS